MVMAKPNKGLGRGLDALLLGNKVQSGEELQNMDLELLKPGQYQPRRRMDSGLLNELAASIKVQGIIQPILARELADGTYEIIAGERRWRAAKLAGLTQLPVLIRKVQDNAVLAMALIENIQREDLNPIEVAVGIQRLIDEFQMTHQTAAEAVGCSRTAASNLLRLLKLPEVVQDMLMANELDMGHARALLSLDAGQLIATANKIVAEKLSVREVEKLVQLITANPKIKDLNNKQIVNRDLLSLQEELAQRMGTGIQIKVGKKGAGKLIIEYTSNDHLEELITRLK